MSEMTGAKFTKANVGVVFEGSQGWHNAYRVIDLAVANGWELTDRDARYVDAYRTGADRLDLPTDETYDARTLDAGEISECVHEIGEDALNFLDSLCDSDVYFEWVDGELFLTDADEEV